MMMLPLTEVDKVMELRTLIILNNPFITDTTLAWFASKTQNIQLMAVRGTSITKHSVQAVRDRFPNSDKLDNENFLGFWPKHRIEDRKMMNKYYYCKQGWIKMQARQRAWLARERVKNIVEKRKRKRAVYVLQRMCRLFASINIVQRRRLQWAAYQRKAVLITSVFYIAVAKKKVFRMRSLLHENYINRMATLMQTRWRMYFAKCVRLEKLRLYNEWLAKRNFGATKFQSIVRVYFSKLRILRIKQMRKARELLIERKSVIIQRVIRGREGRRKADKRRAYLEWFLVRRDTAAAQIQHKARVNYTNKLVAERQARKKLVYKSARSIQSLIRGFMCRLVLAQEGAEEFEIRQDGAATMMQQLLVMKQQRVARAAVVVQCAARARVARIELARRKEEYLNLLKARVDMEMWGVVKIQSLWRGLCGRRRFDLLLRDKKGKWKELYDEDKQRRFFYNKLTGEIRWRMPQDLLDLIPHPKCDNCGFYEALLECGTCNEVYCQQCYDQVHFGGRRKDHEFRTLYDFYGKRLDYGDGEFPSKWPTEVIQDEVQGWMLRVAPIRDPINIHNNSWEEYQEIEADGAPGRNFYFNRNTFEACYDQPQEVTEHLENQQAWADHYAHQALLAEQAAAEYQGFDGKPGGAGAEHHHMVPASSRQTARGMTTGRSTGRLSTVQHPPPPAAPPPDTSRARNYASNTMHNGAVGMMSSSGPRNRLLEDNTANTSRMPPASARGAKDLIEMKKKKKALLHKRGGKTMNAADLEREIELEIAEEEKAARYVENTQGKKKPVLSPAPFSAR
eukprot:GSChrysophyteH1.ASY1.ANO1.1788.1 assembled CDS